MSYLNPRDFYQEVAAGNTEYSYVDKYGTNPDVDTAAAEDLIEQGGTITYPAAAESLEIVSTSGSDANSGGSGAKEVTIEGLDSNWAFQSTTVDTNGVTAAAITGTWLRVFRAYVSETGSSNTNVGQLTIRVASAGATRLIIGVGNGQTLFAGFTVPAAKTGFIKAVEASFAGTIPASVTVTVKLWTRPELDASPWPGAWRVQHILNLQNGGTTRIHHDFAPPIKVIGPCDIRLEVTTSVNDTVVDGRFVVLYK